MSESNEPLILTGIHAQTVRSAAASRGMSVEDACKRMVVLFLSDTVPQHLLDELHKAGGWSE